jgi:hypothetical protein
MASRKQPNKKPRRRLSIQQIVFAIFGIIIILSMVIGSFAF